VCLGLTSSAKTPLQLNSEGEISELMGTCGDFARDLLSDLTRRIKLAEVGSVVQHRYLAGLEVSQSVC